MKQYLDIWHALPSHKKNWALSIAFLLTILILFFYFLQPLKNKRDHLYQSIKTNENNLAIIKKSTQEIRNLKVTQEKVTISDNSRSISEVMDISTKKHELKISRFQPNGDSTAQIWLEDAQFAQVINWINDIENEHQLNITSASITAANKQASGLVSTRLSVISKH